MDQLKIIGGKKLKGSVQVSGAKNAALPILISSLLTEKECVLTNLPKLQDVQTAEKLLSHLGVRFQWSEDRTQATICADQVGETEAPYDLVRKMRASVLVLGPLLARFGRAKVSLPGGCAIGARPINIHLDGLLKMGAKIDLDQGYILAEAKELRGCEVSLEYPSVGATENLMMAASLAKGESLIKNAAKEPEIIDLATVLKKMGVAIEGAGTENIRVQGRSTLDGVEHEIIGDRIEGGTFLAAALITGGEVTVQGLSGESLKAVLDAFRSAGAEVNADTRQISLKAPETIQACEITTQPFPGFPTDMQAQFMAVMCVAQGTSLIRETVFENRFMHVAEFGRLGADIDVQGNLAVVRGKKNLVSAPLMATDLRASAGLVLGALASQGESVISRIYHLDRGYDQMEEKLRALGADVVRVSHS